MIVWLNGPFGVGKTTTARALVPLLPRARTFDPEAVGALLRSQLEDDPVHDFQDWPAWSELVVATAAALVRQTGDSLVLPQTVLHQGRTADLTGALRRKGLPVLHVLLDLGTEELHRRIAESGESLPWRAEHVAGYADARPWLTATADLVVDTSTATPSEVAQTVADACRSRAVVGP